MAGHRFPKDIKPKPCPFCGCGNIYVGVASAMSSGVKCRRCGAKIERPTDTIPRWVVKRYLSWDANCDRMHRYAAIMAVKAWNKRSKKPEVR